MDQKFQGIQLKLLNPSGNTLQHTKFQSNSVDFRQLSQAHTETIAQNASSPNIPNDNCCSAICDISYGFCQNYCPNIYQPCSNFCHRFWHGCAQTCCSCECSCECGCCEVCNCVIVANCIQNCFGATFRCLGGVLSGLCQSLGACC